MLKLILVSAVILFICMLFLCLNIILKKHGTFPKTHVSQNKELRRRGINCVQSQDFEMRHKKKGVKEKI